MAFNVNEFFESVDIILTQRLADLSYDKTVIATIIDDSDKEKGHYVVSDGTIKFDAYSNDDSYEVDDQVRITVLNGDWSQRKFIAGKYSDKDSVSTAVKYMPPLGTTMQDNQSTLTNTNEVWTLSTNSNVYKQSIWSMKITPDSKFYTLQANGIYNVITLQGDFRTNMGSLGAGNYGLLLELFITPDENSNQRIRKFITFDSSEMMGNPYSFVIDSRQSKQILIASEGIVTEVVLSIYQGKTFDVANGTLVETDNLFKDYSGNRVDGQPIRFKNVVVGFGSDLTKVEDNKLQIYTTSSPAYHYNGGTGDETNYKTMGMVWYNKTADNEYIGFSDGLYDLNYDEINYLQTKWADVRLINQKGKGNIPTDELSLNLAANIAEAEPLMTNVYSMLTKELSTVLQAIGRSIGGTALKEELDKLISSYTENGTTFKAKLVQYQDTAREATQNLVTLYKDILQYGYNKQNGIEHTWKPEWNTTSYYTTFKNAITGALTAVQNDFMVRFDSETLASGVLSGYRGVYDSYHNKIANIIIAIQDMEKEIKCFTYYNNREQYDELWLREYQAKTDFSPYAEPDLSGYDNKYCIYWYRYNPHYNLTYMSIDSQADWEANKTNHNTYNDYVLACENNNREYKFAQFLGPHWERVTAYVKKDEPNTVVNIKNFGLPTTEGRTEEGDKYYPASPTSEQFLQLKMDPTFPEERYQVVLFYNHDMVKSNIITFTNTEADLIPDEFNVDADDVLLIEHGAHSQEHYQSYTSAFDLVNVADESRSRDLRVSYDGVSVGDEALAGAEIYWYMPVNSTMLTYDERYLTETLGFIVCKDTTPYSKNGYIYFYKQINYTSETVDATDVDGNLIYNADGTVAKDEKITVDEADRHFSYKIKPFYEASAQNNNIIVEAHVHGKNGEVKVTSGEIFFTFSTFGSNGTKYTLTLTPASTQVATLPTQSLSLNLALRDAEGNLIQLNDSALGNLDAEPGVLNTYQLRVDWYAKSANPSAIGLNDIADSQMKLVSVGNPVSGNNSKYVGIVQAKVSYKTEGRNATTPRTITLSTLQPIAYSSSENYYISGPTTIVYNNQGTVSRLSEEPFRLYTKENGVEAAIENQEWVLLYYDNKGDPVSDADVLRYLPTLNGDNTLMPAPMYYHYDKNSFYVPVAQCKIGSDVLWTQPIVITQNQYASSTLNDWNGQFVIDENNGTILSTMVGAGRKTESNAFEGVLMGDIENGANIEKGQADGIGIYGFNEGAQSFFFGVNGKAFIGKAGAGRLCFDGNNGFLYSGNWLSSFDSLGDAFKVYSNNPRVLGLNQGKDGLAIDLQHGHIDAYNFKVTSKNIYLNSNPEDKSGEGSYYFRIGHNGTALSDSYSDLNGDAIQPTRGYMALNKDGDLEIRANNLSITGQLGGVNLLKQTEPKRIIPIRKIHNTTNQEVPATDTFGNPIFDWNVAKQSTYEKYKTYCDGLGFTPLQESEWNDLPPLAWDSNNKLAGSYPNTSFTEEANHNGNKHYLAITGSGNRSVSQTITEIKKGESYTVSGYVSGLTGSGNLTISFNRNITVPQWSDGNNKISYSKSPWTKFEHTIQVNDEATDLTITFTSTTDFALWHAKFESGAIASAWSPAPSDTEDTISGEQEKYDIYLNQDRVFEKLITDDNGNQMVGIWLQSGGETASGQNELYINATYMAAGILRSRNWDGKLTAIELKDKQGNVQKDTYGNKLYTYSIAQAPKAGLYLNLDEGKMWAANFELNAGNASTDNDGLYLNSDPENGQRWFYVGDANNHISFAKNSSGTSSLSLKMQGNYLLETTGTNAIYFSNTSKSIAGITGAETTDKFVLAVGTNFAVTDTGKLYITGARVNGSIYAQNGEIGGWNIGTNTLTSVGLKSDNTTPLITLNGSTGTISGGTLSGATVSGGKIVGSAIYAQTLDIGGYTDGTVGSGAFSVASDGSVSIGTATNGVYPFSVTNSGSLTARAGTIGGWTVTAPSGNAGGGFSYGNMNINTKDGLTFGSADQFSVDASGNLKATSAVFDTSLKVLSKRAEGSQVFYVDSSGNTEIIGNLKFEGNIQLGKNFQYSGYGSAGDGGTQKTPTNDGSGFKSIKVDTPWSSTKGTMTFYNGILVGFKTESSTLKDFLNWLFGKEDAGDGSQDTKSYGSATRPIYINKGTFTAMDRGTAGQLFMGQGTLKDPAWTTVTGFTNDAANRKFGLSRVTSGTDENKFYVQIPTFIKSGSTAAPGLVPSPGTTAGTTKFLCEDASWKAIPTYSGCTTSKAGTAGLVPAAAANGTTKYLAGNGSWTDLPTIPTLSSLLPAMANNSGKVLKVNSSGNGVYWGTDNNTTYDLSSASVSYADEAGDADSVNARSTTSYSYVAGCNSTGSGTYLRQSGVKVSDVSTSSSRLYKNTIQDINNSHLLYQLRPVSYFYNEDMQLGKDRRYGFIAEEVEQILPDLISYFTDDNDERYSISLYYNSILTLAVAEIQKLRKELDELKSNLNKE